MEPMLPAAPWVLLLTVALPATVPIIPQILLATLLTISARFMTTSTRFMTISVRIMTISTRFMITSARFMTTSNILLIVFVNLPDHRRQAF